MEKIKVEQKEDFEITLDKIMGKLLSKRGAFFRCLFQRNTYGVESEDDTPDDIALENKAHAAKLEWLGNR
jgi:hypothetical protein